MKLLVDVGNTNIKIALCSNGNILQVYRMKSIRDKTSDEYYLSLREMFDLSLIKSIAISSVVPQITYVFNEMFLKFSKANLLILDNKINTFIKVIADNPKEVGADLLCDAKGLLGEEALIVDLGTATKYIYVKDNTIKGLAIAPGVEISIKALVSDTALLPNIDINTPKSVLGNNTVDCMQSGVIYSTVFAVDGFINSIRETNKDLKVIATGGLANLIAPLCSNNIVVDDLLNLKGLYEILKENEED